MPTLAEDLQQLLAVQAVDSRIDRARAEQAALDTGAALAAAYNTGKAAFDTLHADAIKAQGEQRDAELRLQTIENDSAATNAKMYGTQALGARELSDLQKKLEMLGRQKDEAEEKTLLAMESASETMAKAHIAERELLALAEKYKRVRAAYKERHAALEAEIAAAVSERAGVAAPVTPTLLARYETIRARRGGVGAAPLLPDESCGACRTSVSSFIANDVRALKNPITCENCGRILAPPPVV